ncbi:MAG: Rieske (2Fe-2S) protein [Alphaproteobacteria bacterium]|nr:MAG: Rieske (2Fe-2S) protein [Alphaproteobacteria bacterium]
MSKTSESLVEAGSLEALKARGKQIFKHGSKQILLMFREDKVWACNNRCPHEGYPLAEGTLTGSCTLTCNWHNWKFDLTNGETLVGGDTLRQYPVTLKGDQIWLDITDPAPETRIPKVMDDLFVAIYDYDYTRIARELARLDKLGADPLAAVRQALAWTHDHYEYGMSHANAAAADWLTLRRTLNGDPAKNLICLIEPVAHMAWDTLRQPQFPYTEEVQEYDPGALTEAIENENEDAAIALCRGALRDGLTFRDLEPVLAAAALAHYNDFGHSAIYVTKVGELIEHLGEEATAPALFALIRELVYATREDLIPEFRGYAQALADWDGQGGKPVTYQDLIGLSVNKVMARVLESSARPQELYDALLAASAWNYLHFDLKYQRHTDLSVASNVDWLDFTHAITFANAVRTLCEKEQALWPQAVLQMACFVGRNTGFVDKTLDVSGWESDLASLDHWFEHLFDHAQFEHIVSCHLLKMATAIKAEIAHAPEAPFVPLVIAAHNRFLATGVKRRHVARTATQALEFVARED